MCQQAGGALSRCGTSVGPSTPVPAHDRESTASIPGSAPRSRAPPRTGSAGGPGRPGMEVVRSRRGRSGRGQIGEGGERREAVGQRRAAQAHVERCSLQKLPNRQDPRARLPAGPGTTRMTIVPVDTTGRGTDGRTPRCLVHPSRLLHSTGQATVGLAGEQAALDPTFGFRDRRDAHTMQERLAPRASGLVPGGPHQPGYCRSGKGRRHHFQTTTDARGRRTP